MSFTSTAKGNNRFSDTGEKGSDENTSGRDRRMVSDRFGRDRDNDRHRERNGYLNSRNGEDDAEGWQTARPRKSFGQEDGDRWQRNGDRNRDRFQRNNDGDRDGRRNGEGRERFDRRWTREDTPVAAGESDGKDTERMGGWRDRDRNRRDEREWGRGGRFDTRAEDVPEWMDEPVNESKQAKNVNDFEAWKAQQKAKQAGKPEDTEVTSPPTAAEEPKAAPLFALAGKGLFGMYGEGKKPDAETTNGTATTKPAAKAKASKFAGFFSKEEEPLEAVQHPPAASPPPVANLANEADKEGFNRILALLGKSNISSPPPSVGSAPPQQLLGRPPPEPQSPESEQRAGRRSQNIFEEQPFSQGAPPHGARDGPLSLQSHREQLASPSLDLGPFSPTRDGAATAPNSKGSPFSAPDSQGKPQMDANHAFLLNLMQSRTNPQPQQQLPMSPASDLNSNFVFPENKPTKQQMLQEYERQARLRDEQQAREHQARMRGFPPGFMDERQLFEVEQQRQREMERPRTELGRKPSQPGAGPPGFFDDPAIAGLQRRQNDPPSRQMQQNLHNQGLPRQMLPHGDDFIKMGLPPGMRAPPQTQDSVGPPPGFGVGVPPGFAPPPPAGAPPPLRLPTQQQQQQQQRAQGMPAMFSPGGHNIMPPPQGGPQGPHGTGYFGPGPGAPPGFGRPPGGPNIPQLPPGMAMPPQGQRPPFDMMAEMQQRGGGRGGPGLYGP